MPNKKKVKIAAIFLFQAHNLLRIWVNMLMKKKRILTLLALFPLFLSAQTGPEWMDGKWQGIGYQLNTQSTWSIDFWGRSAENEFSIQYPSLKCGGNWKLNAFDETQAWFKEEIEFEKMNCLDLGTIVITRINENHITFTYFNPISKALEAFSTLEKIPEN